MKKYKRLFEMRPIKSGMSRHSEPFETGAEGMGIEDMVPGYDEALATMTEIGEKFGKEVFTMLSQVVAENLPDDEQGDRWQDEEEPYEEFPEPEPENVPEDDPEWGAEISKFNSEQMPSLRR